LTDLFIFCYYLDNI